MFPFLKAEMLLLALQQEVALRRHWQRLGLSGQLQRQDWRKHRRRGWKQRRSAGIAR